MIFVYLKGILFYNLELVFLIEHRIYEKNTNSR